MKSFKVSPYKKKENSNIEENSDYVELDKNVENGIVNKKEKTIPEKEEKVEETIKEATKEYSVKNDFVENNSSEDDEDVETI